VKDSQRTKTDEATLRTLTVVWGCAGLEARLERAIDWYGDLLARAGCTVEDVRIAGSGGGRKE
jgi:hypothetical protein